MTKNIVLEDVLAEENLSAAWQHLKNKSDIAGLDGIRFSEMPEYLRLNKEKIIADIYSGQYMPGIVSRHEVLKANGKRRSIAIMNAIDRYISRAIAQKLLDYLEPQFSQNSFAYRVGIGAADAAACAARYMEKGKCWVAETDIKQYFDSIPHNPLLHIIKKTISDYRLMDLIARYISCQVEEDGIISSVDRGVLQGSPLSPVLANLYLNDLDWTLESKGVSFYRYGDDINVYTSTCEEAYEIRKDIEKMLRRKGLVINKEKGGVFQGIHRHCLGFEFIEKNKRIIVKRSEHKKKQIYDRWQRTAIQKIDRQYHLVNDGILTRKDFTILFENGEGKYYLPAETIDSLNIYSSVTLSGTFLEYASRQGIMVALFDQLGEKIGMFIPQNSRRDYRVEAKQLQLLQCEKEHLKIAKKYQNANVFNLRAILRYYERRGHCAEIVEAVLFLTDLLQKVNEVKEINMLMMYEAQARQRYYQCFNVILQDHNFGYSKRTRRPPKDALNAMLSFGNTLLYQRFANMITNSSLDIRFGLMHNSWHRSESLNLDLADLFKPVLVDRTIFTLVNRKMINVATDFRELERDGVYMNHRGKRIFLEEFNRKFHQMVKVHSVQKSYEDLMRDEVRKIERYFCAGEEYKPYKYVN